MKVLKALGYLVLVLGLNSCSISFSTIELASVLNLLPIDLEAYLWYIHRDYSLMNIIFAHSIIFTIFVFFAIIMKKPKLIISFPILLLLLYFMIQPIKDFIKYKFIVPKYEKLGAEVLKKFPRKKLNVPPRHILGFNAVSIFEDSAQKDVEAYFAKEMHQLNLYHILVSDSTVYFVKYTSGLGMEAIAYSNCDVCGGEDRQGKAYVLPCRRVKKSMYDLSFFDA